MTKLRDDGNLEIGAQPKNDSDAVVVACFLEKTDRHGTKITTVGPGWWTGMDKRGDWPHGAAILIPAATVAEKVDFDRSLGGNGFVYEVLLLVFGCEDFPGVYIDDWLRTHTQKSTP